MFYSVKIIDLLYFFKKFKKKRATAEYSAHPPI